MQTPRGLRSLKWQVEAGNVRYEHRRDDGEVDERLLRAVRRGEGLVRRRCREVKSAAFNPLAAGCSSPPGSAFAPAGCMTAEDWLLPFDFGGRMSAVAETGQRAFSRWPAGLA